MTHAVSLQNISRIFGATRAVDDVSLDIVPGEFFALLGPSGSGKTTALRLIAGFEQPDAGSIRIFGDNVEGVPPYRRAVNTVFQDYALFPHMSVGENVAYGLMVRGVPKPERAAKAAEALAQVKLGGYDTRRPAQLSGGQRQRVALARALVNQPKVLLLDEPLGALDLKLREQMQVELKALQQAVGITFVFVTHDQGEALSMADRVAIFNNGRIVQVGTPQDIYERPQSRFVADFVGSSNVLAPDLAAKFGGARVWCSLRPEKIHLLAAGANADGLLSTPAVLETAHYQGAVTRLTFNASGARLTASVPAGAVSLAPGAAATLTWAKEAMHGMGEEEG